MTVRLLVVDEDTRYLKRAVEHFDGSDVDATSACSAADARLLLESATFDVVAAPDRVDGEDVEALVAAVASETPVVPRGEKSALAALAARVSSVDDVT